MYVLLPHLAISDLQQNFLVHFKVFSNSHIIDLNELDCCLSHNVHALAGLTTQNKCVNLSNDLRSLRENIYSQG